MRTITKNGRIAGWELEGLTSVNGIAIPDQGGGPWRVVAVQDMDGEGDVDFVWQNTRNGRAAIWLLDENLGFES